MLLLVGQQEEQSMSGNITHMLVSELLTYIAQLGCVNVLRI